MSPKDIANLPDKAKKDLELSVNTFFFISSRFATVYKKGNRLDELEVDEDEIRCL